MMVATNSLKAWILATRPKTLGAITCPMLLGNALALAHDQFSWFWCALIVVNGLLLQILANVVNDYGDFMRGADKEDRLGPPRAMQMGWITKTAMHMGIGILLLLISGFGLWLVYAAGPMVFYCGVIAVMLCVGYTLGPLPLAYLGFVEIIVFLVFGPMIVLGSYYVQTQSITGEALVLCISPGFLASALLLTNNLRDILQDKKNHKRTMAVRLGEGFSRKAIMVLVVLASISPILLVVLYNFHPMVLLSLVSLALPLRHARMILHDPISRQFNLMLGDIGKSLYLLGIIMSLGILYGAP